MTQRRRNKTHAVKQISLLSKLFFMNMCDKINERVPCFGAVLDNSYVVCVEDEHHTFTTYADMGKFMYSLYEHHFNDDMYVAVRQAADIAWENAIRARLANDVLRGERIFDAGIPINYKTAYGVSNQYHD